MPETTLTLAVLAPAPDAFERTVGVVRDLLYLDREDGLDGLADVLVSVNGIETYRVEVAVRYRYLGEGLWDVRWVCDLGDVTDLDGEWIDDDDEAVRISEFVERTADFRDIPIDALSAYRQAWIALPREQAAKILQHWDDLLAK